MIYYDADEHMIFNLSYYRHFRIDPKARSEGSREPLLFQVRGYHNGGFPETENDWGERGFDVLFESPTHKECVEFVRKVADVLSAKPFSEQVEDWLEKTNQDMENRIGNIDD